MNTSIQFDYVLLNRAWDSSLPFREACVAIMRQVREGCTWTMDEPGQFQIALAIILGNAVGEDKAWVETQVESIKMLNAFLGAAAAGLQVVPPTVAANPRGYALLALWRESKR